MTFSYPYRRRYLRIETGKGRFFLSPTGESRTTHYKTGKQLSSKSEQFDETWTVTRQKIAVERSELVVTFVILLLLTIAWVDSTGIFIFAALVIIFAVLIGRSRFAKNEDGKRKLDLINSTHAFFSSLRKYRNVKLAWSAAKIYARQ